MLFGAPGSQFGYFHEKVPILGEIDFAKFRSRSVHRILKIQRASKVLFWFGPQNAETLGSAVDCGIYIHRVRFCQKKTHFTKFAEISPKKLRKVPKVRFLLLCLICLHHRNT